MKKDRQLLLAFKRKSDKRMPLLSIPLLAEVIGSAQPELLDGTASSRALLKEISSYLFDQENLQNLKLRKALKPDLYFSIYGLKSLLREHSLENVQQIMSESKTRLGRWLEKEMEEE